MERTKPNQAEGAQLLAVDAADLLRRSWSEAQARGLSEDGTDLAAVLFEGEADPSQEVACFALEAAAAGGTPDGQLVEFERLITGEDPGSSLEHWQYGQADDDGELVPRTAAEFQSLVNAALEILSSSAWWWTWLVVATSSLPEEDADQTIDSWLADHPVQQLEAVTGHQ